MILGRVFPVGFPKESEREEVHNVRDLACAEWCHRAIQPVDYNVVTGVTACRRCATRHVHIECMCLSLRASSEIAPVRAGCRQVIDAAGIVLENPFRSHNGRLTGQCALILR